jgi:hypothetical protein
MSLVGSLEDLGLGDILQIISLSRKSGLLVLRSEYGEGQILFDAGLIRCAHTKGGATELGELLATEGGLAADALEAASQDARSRGCPLADVLAGRGLLSPEAVDQIRRDHIESAAFEMFSWSAGEFSFEVREVEDDGGGLFATPGINPQFLALEGTRRVDEDLHEEAEGEELAFGIVEDDDTGELAVAAPEPAEAGPSPAAVDPFAAAEPVLEVEGEPALEAEIASPVAEPPGPAEVLGEELEAEVADAEPETPLDAEPETPLDAVPLAAANPFEEEAHVEAESEPVRPSPDAVAVVAAAVVQEIAPATPVLSEDDLVEPGVPEGENALEEAPATPQPAPAGPIRRPLVLIDPDLPALEWAKDALQSAFSRVHIFQRTDLGIQRIRQYLARAEVPVVVLSLNAPPDPVSGAREPTKMAARLHKQSPRMAIALWRDPEEAAPQGGAYPLVSKPTPTQLADPRRGADRQRLAEELVVELMRLAESGSRPAPPAPAGDLKRLRESSARIREGASQGEVLPQVLAFAAQTFSRVALFMIRDDQAIGIAQSGLPTAGGPDDQALRGVHLGCRESAAFRKVIETRQPTRGTPLDEGDQRLCVMLGNEIPDELYVAPIESADRVVALLVGDNLPGREPIGDTGALEVLLDSAGIALDRALLKRTLAESDG